jgi:hypothetical protein
MCVPPLHGSGLGRDLQENPNNISD